jgi:hypothetical protein
MRQLGVVDTESSGQALRGHLPPWLEEVCPGYGSRCAGWAEGEGKEIECCGELRGTDSEVTMGWRDGCGHVPGCHDKCTLKQQELSSHRWRPEV